MLTIVAYVLIALSLWMSTLYHLFIVCRASAYRIDESTRSSRIYRLGGLSVVVPAKNEPIDVIRQCFSSFIRAAEDRDAELVMVLDDPIERVRGIVEFVKPYLNRGVMVLRLNAVGGRNSALSDGVKFSRFNKVMIADVDSVFSPRLLVDAESCECVCVARWKTYRISNTFVEEAISFLTDFGSWLYYKMKSRANLFIYPLGSGTILRKDVIESLGYWRSDIIQDDMWLGTQLAKRGIVPRVLSSELLVGVPSSLEGVRIQQCRWAFGTSEVLSRFWRDVVRAPLRLSMKLDALVYISQPLASLVGFTGFSIAALASWLETQSFTTVLPLIALIIGAMAIESFVMYMFVVDEGLDKRRAKFLMGRTSALVTLLTPLLAVYTFAGLIRKKIPYRITPKGSTSARSIDISIMLFFCLAIVTLIPCIAKGFITAITPIALAELAVAMYSLVRFR